jgi:hypothetical protein
MKDAGGSPYELFGCVQDRLLVGEYVNPETAA